MLTRQFGDLDVAEDAVAEAFATAVERWHIKGLPSDPGGWLTTTARRKALDRIRREGRRAEKHQLALVLDAALPSGPVGAIDDEQLRLLFVCCHPVLPVESRVASTLRMVSGLTVPEIARAFLVQETTMGQRISRAKARIRSAGIPFQVPTDQDLAERLAGVLAVLHARQMALGFALGSAAVLAGPALSVELGERPIEDRARGDQPLGLQR